MAEKKFFVDINLQGNKLANSVVGANSSMTTAGAFQYNAGRLEYYNGATVQEVANLADIAAVTGGLILQGGYNASTNTPDIAADSSVLKGFFWVVTAAGTFLGEAVQVGDSIIAKQDNPGATAANWLILQGNVVIATDSVDGISRLATQAEANDGTEGGAVVITPATLQGKIDAQITPEINSKLPLAGGTMSGNIDLGGHNINNAENVSIANLEVANLYPMGDANPINVVADLDFTNNKTIINLPAPTNGGDAANKTYVDNAASTAQSNAEATASADATTKANAAQTAAEAYADSLAPNYDAAGSAATAESNANTYTDTAIDNTRVTSSFLVSSWVSNSGEYYLDVTHNLESDYLIVQVVDGNTNKIAEFVEEFISNNTVRIFSNTLPTGIVFVSVRK